MSRASSSAVAGIEGLFHEFGQRLAQSILDGLNSKLAHAGSRVAAAAPAAAAPRRGPGRPPRSAAEAKCIVPDCNRRSVAKKLCPTHYRKAGRLDMNGTLTAADLEVLRKDGRATRWENAKKGKKAGKKGK
jgi:hypothetical protein